jgi:hypothetical protein
MHRIFRQCRSTALQKYSPLAIRYSLFAVVLAEVGGYEREAC